MRTYPGVRRAVLIVAALVVVAGAAAIWFAVRTPVAQPPGCTVAPVSGSGDFTLSPEQAGNAATIAAAGQQLGMPDHAVTVALATAMQESKLTNLPGGDRDSAGLFQQRPSQGWGTYAQVVDPVHASITFYNHLRAVPNWQQLAVTDAAQQVQHSAAADAYAQWEEEARAVAVALTGQTPGALTCHDLKIGAPTASLTTTAAAEWGTSALSGPQAPTRGWAISLWLVAHAGPFGVDRVSFGGRTWTAASGMWSAASSVANTVSWHQVQGSTGQGGQG